MPKWFKVIYLRWRNRNDAEQLTLKHFQNVFLFHYLMKTKSSEKFSKKSLHPLSLWPSGVGCLGCRLKSYALPVSSEITQNQQKDRLEPSFPTVQSSTPTVCYRVTFSLFSPHIKIFLIKAYWKQTPLQNVSVLMKQHWFLLQFHIGECFPSSM